MACELVIHKNVNNYTHADEEKDRRGVYKKGYIVDIRENLLNRHSVAEHASFAFAKVTDATAEELEDRTKTWELEVDHALVGSNLTIDGHRYRLFSVNPGVSFRGQITQAKAQKYLDNWNVDIFSTAQNEIVMDIIIFDMLKSKGFWDRDEGLAGLVATEISYNQGTGEHIIEVDWTNFLPDVPRNNIAQELQDRILERGGTVVSADLPNNKGQFSMFRNDVLLWFKKDVYDQVRKNHVVYRRQYYIEENLVDILINYTANNGGAIYEVTKSQLATYVKSFLDKVDA